MATTTSISERSKKRRWLAIGVIGSAVLCSVVSDWKLVTQPFARALDAKSSRPISPGSVAANASLYPTSEDASTTTKAQPLEDSTKPDEDEVPSSQDTTKPLEEKPPNKTLDTPNAEPLDTTQPEQKSFQEKPSDDSPSQKATRAKEDPPKESLDTTGTEEEPPKEEAHDSDRYEDHLPKFWDEEAVLRLDRIVLEAANHNNTQTQAIPLRLNLTDRLHKIVRLDTTTGRLVVNVGDEVLVWNNEGGWNQRTLVRILRAMTLKSSLDQIYFPANEPDTNHQENKTYTVVRNKVGQAILARPPLLNLTMECRGKKSPHNAYGQGNWVIAIELVRMAAATAQVEFECRCHQEADEKGPLEHDLLTPWFTGFRPSIPPNQLVRWPYDPSGRIPTQKEILVGSSKAQDQPVHKMSQAVIEDVRRMVQRMQQESSLLDDVVYDDVAIHFRCGDVMGKNGWRNDYGLTKFTEYPKHVRQHIHNDSEVHSIGIITQPWNRTLLRKQDTGTEDKCRRATHRMVDYLQKEFPMAKISIHNGPTETLPIAYARLVLARLVSFASISTFGIFPTMATHGKAGYFQKGFEWANVLPEQYPNLHSMTRPHLGAAQVFYLESFQDTLQWLVTDEACVQRENKKPVLRTCDEEGNMIMDQ